MASSVSASIAKASMIGVSSAKREQGEREGHGGCGLQALAPRRGS